MATKSKFSSVRGITYRYTHAGNNKHVDSAKRLAPVRVCHVNSSNGPTPVVLRTSPGEAPYFSLNARQKWLVELNPQRNAISEMRCRL